MSARSPGDRMSGESTVTGAGRSPASVPICRTAPFTGRPVFSSMIIMWYVRVLQALSIRNRYQAGSTSRCGQIVPLTSVYGPRNPAVMYGGAASA